MKVLVLSDTHAPTRWRAVPPALLPELASADVILHAGDVCTPELLDLLAGHAPVHVVLGNNDGEAVAAWGGGVGERLTVELGGVRFGMVHDSGARDGRRRRMRAWFPDADVVVYGHSHIPFDEEIDRLRLFNPGSPTDRRTQRHGSYGLFRIEDGQVLEHRIVLLT